MAKYRKKPVVIEATQFNYIDNIDGPKTCELAKSLGLSRNGTSLYGRALPKKAGV